MTVFLPLQPSLPQVFTFYMVFQSLVHNTIRTGTHIAPKGDREAQLPFILIYGNIRYQKCLPGVLDCRCGTPVNLSPLRLELIGSHPASSTVLSQASRVYSNILPLCEKACAWTESSCMLRNGTLCCRFDRQKRRIGGRIFRLHPRDWTAKRLHKF